MDGRFGRLKPRCPRPISTNVDPTSTTDLPECDRRFRAAFAQAAIGVAIIDSQGMFLYANQALSQITGYGEQELLGMHFTATLHPDDREQRLEIFGKILAGEIGSFINERRMLRKDGTSSWARTSVTIPQEWPAPPQVIVFTEDITERKQTEEALRASEERFRIAAENASDLIYEWDLRTDQVDVFGPAHQQLGDWPSPRSSEAWRKIVHPEDLPLVLAAMQHCIQSGERYKGSYRIIGQSGKIYHYSNRGQVIRNQAGEPEKWIGLCTDITERKQAEEAMAQLAAIVQCSESAIFATNLEGGVITWNGGAQKLSGYTAVEALALPVTALFGSPDCVHDILSQIRNGLSSRIDEAYLRRKDGSQVPVLLTVSPIRKSGGEVSGGAVIARDISERKEAEREMAHRALHDHLTGLPNRLLLSERLSESIAAAERARAATAVIFVDLDGFKFVNDTLGHEAGDALLQQVAERLGACIRQEDMLARMGGDEFMLVVNRVAGEEVALSIAERLREALRAPFFVAHHELVVTASVGISIYPRDGTDESTLRRNADTAMYEAKQSGKDRVRLYRPALGAAFQARLELETDLRHAIEREELRLFYQPVYSVTGDRQTAYEALARWPHPRLGLLSPNGFIPLAEETGLIVPLGEWVLREACRRCHCWQEQGSPQVRVAVNVSPLQFARPDFVDTVLAVLRETGLPGALLDLELTESIVMNDIESAIEKMTRLRGQGVRISVDDFGTGYSSLGYLPRLPIDILKIDRCFVALIGENDAAVRLIQGMISLAHSLGKRVIVEGVETAAQLEILRHLGCDEVQGYLMGAPAPLGDSSQQLLIA